MDDQPLDLNTQKLILRAKVLIVLAIAISLLFVIQGLIGIDTYIDTMDTGQQWVNFGIDVLVVIFPVFTLFIILLKKERRIRSITACFIFFSFFIIIVDIYYLFIFSLLSSFLIEFIMAIIEVILLYLFYQKTKGKQPAPRLAYGLFITWILLFVVFVFVKIVYLPSLFVFFAIYQQDYFAVFTTILGFIMSYFAPFVLCWIAFMSVRNEGFYEVL